MRGIDVDLGKVCETKACECDVGADWVGSGQSKLTKSGKEVDNMTGMVQI